MRLVNIPSAKTAIDNMLREEPTNYYVDLCRIALRDTVEQRVQELQELAAKHPYSAPIRNQLARELQSATAHRTKGLEGTTADDIVAILEESQRLDPRITNPAYSELFDLLVDNIARCSDRNKKVDALVKFHMDQNAFAPETCSVLFRYCKWKKTTDVQGDSLFRLLERAYDSHFPREIEEHLEVIVDACVEFNQFYLLKRTLSLAQENRELRSSVEFCKLLMRVTYEVFRDINTAISMGNKFLEKKRSLDIDKVLFSYYLDAGRPQEARDCLRRMRGLVSVVKAMEFEAQIAEYSGQPQDAIDIIQAIPDKRDFEENYTARLAYLDLIKGDYAGASGRLRKFLEPRGYSMHCQVETINFEFARFQLGQKKTGSTKRLSRIAESPQTRVIEAVSKLLLGDLAAALEILEAEATKDFSRMADFLSWPVLKDIRTELTEINSKLLAAKRKLDDL